MTTLKKSGFFNKITPPKNSLPAVTSRMPACQSSSLGDAGGEYPDVTSGSEMPRVKEGLGVRN